MNFYAILWVGVLVAVMIASYLLNKRTPLPEGCEEVVCEGCADIACSHNAAHQKEE